MKPDNSISDTFIKLVEGAYYPFLVEGTIQTPDGDWWIKLKDPNGYKHLLKNEYYADYNLKVGQIIQCRIDHINCAGKIYIEPQHPCYQLGQIYTFKSKGIETFINKQGEHEKSICLEDCFGNEILAIAEKEVLQGEHISARVSRIKKGRVYVNLDVDPPAFKDVADGEFHLFEITGFRTVSKKYEYFVLKDRQERKYMLRSKYYQHYNLKIGKTIQCRMIREEKDFYFEPAHPHYKINGIYPFTIVGRTEIMNYPEQRIPAIELINAFGKNIILPVDKGINSKIKNGRINCQVCDIRKSEVLLDCKKKSPF